MSIPEFNDLFHDSGAQGILDFLLSKLKVNDLSPNEALAMLSAVHEKMGEGSDTDPKVYKTYTGFMKSLQREMPEVYVYVVSAWNRRNGTESIETNTQETNIDEFDASVSKPQGIEEKIDSGFKEVKVLDGESDEVEESQEPGENEEKEITEVEKTDDDGDELKMDRSEEETEEDEGDKKEANDEEPEESSEDNKVGELETDEAEENGIEKADAESETDEKETEVDEEAEPIEVPDESITESDKGDPEEEAKGEQSETEWPEVEEPSSEEPLEGLQNEDGSFIAED